MKRKRLGRRERWLVFERSDGRCCDCKCQLEFDGSWHADHIIPFSETKRTFASEMQSLCPACNLKKGTKHGIQPSDIFPCYNGARKRNQ